MYCQHLHGVQHSSMDLGSNKTTLHILLFFKLRFTLCKAEQPLGDMELQEKDPQEICLELEAIYIIV